MNYKKSCYLKWEYWNNAFNYRKRKNKELFIPELISLKVNNLEELKNIFKLEKIKLWNKIVFEDYDFNDKLQSCYWLKNFYEIEIDINSESNIKTNLNIKILNKTKKIYLFDNHNHAYYFWYLARNKKLIQDNSILFHIDEHADTRDPILDNNYLNYEKPWLNKDILNIKTTKYLLKPESLNLDNIYKYTNYYLNVWNYIIPAEREWLVSKTIQIKTEFALREYLGWKYTKYLSPNKSIILNLDLDFFQPDLDFIDYDFKKEVILDLMNKADIITVATSPFFIDQDLAIKVFKDIVQSFYKS